MAGNGKNRFALFGRGLCRDQGAAFQAGFGDNHAKAQPADNAVAAREMIFLQGQGLGQEFADDGAAALLNVRLKL